MKTTPLVMCSVDGSPPQPCPGGVTSEELGGWRLDTYTTWYYANSRLGHRVSVEMTLPGLGDFTSVARLFFLTLDPNAPDPDNPVRVHLADVEAIRGR